MTQTTTALQRIEETAIEQSAFDVALELTPEELERRIQRETQMRSIVVKYFQSAMKQSHHYYNLPGQESRKPALSKEGALNLMSLFKVVAQPEPPKEVYADDENGIQHYTVTYRVHLMNQSGAIIATGDGLCSTRESKYAYRWEYENKVSANQRILEYREFKSRDTGKPYTKCKVANDDLPDLFNTVLKMAHKRALVDAVLKLPLVSELFTQDLEEQIAESAQAKPKQNSGSVNRPRPVEQKQEENPEELKAARHTVNNLLSKLPDEEQKRVLNGRVVEMMPLGPLMDLQAHLEELV